MNGSTNTSTADEPEQSYVSKHAPHRARAIRFLATRTSALSGAYAMTVSASGEITLQGEHGALQELVAMWGADQSSAEDAAVPAGYREWKVAMGDDPFPINIRLVEEGAPERAWCDACDSVATPRHFASEHYASSAVSA